MSARPPLATMVLVTSLFLLGGLMNSLNNVLTGQFKQGFELTDLRAALVQLVFYFGYFVIALPVGLLIDRKGSRSRRPQREQPTVLPVR